MDIKILMLVPLLRVKAQYKVDLDSELNPRVMVHITLLMKYLLMIKLLEHMDSNLDSKIKLSLYKDLDMLDTGSPNSLLPLEPNLLVSKNGMDLYSNLKDLILIILKNTLIEPGMSLLIEVLKKLSMITHYSLLLVTS